VKLTELFAIADKLGADFVATGHYARVRADAGSGEPRIAEGKDKTKDQSYFLYATPREQIARLLFPLGESKKAEVRAEAVARKIPGATKGESQELCFVGAGAHAYEKFIEERAGEIPPGTGGRARVRPGNIVDADGRIVGQHDGVFRFTVGQRKGLGVALGKPAFVTRIDADTATVSLGGADDLLAREAVLDSLQLGAGVTLPLHARIRVRYRHEGAMGQIVRIEDRAAEGAVGGGQGRARVTFDTPVRAVTPGQICVFYNDDVVLGGGRIAIPGEKSAGDVTGAESAA
jgi:tRNA-specific 2-thiouridylase